MQKHPNQAFLLQIQEFLFLHELLRLYTFEGVDFKYDNNFFKFHHHLYNILRHFDVLPNFPFPKGETMRDYYLSTRYKRYVSRLAERLKKRLSHLKKLGKMMKVSKLHRMIA